jgi:Spermine/spermidine synthase domain
VPALFNRKNAFLFLIIGVEGYVVLATELLAIRELIPFVGSGVEVVSIVISAILLPLAGGYYLGGQRVKKELAGLGAISIRGMVLKNLLWTIVVLTLGFSYVVLEMFFKFLEQLGLHHRIVQTAVYSTVFLVAPAFFLAQTVPLVSNYFPRAKLSQITGRMLFCSTAGSFLGSVFSTLLLMHTVGVHNTANFTITLIAVLIVLVTPRRRGLGRAPVSWPRMGNQFAIACAIFMWCINGSAFLRNLGVVADTPYSLIQIAKVPAQDAAILLINRSLASKYAPDQANRFQYVQYIENQFIQPLRGTPPRDILVLGAGGFTLGWDDRTNRYTFVDIDPALQPAAEANLLPAPLPPNKHVVVTSARAFLKRTSARYDLVVDDLFTNIVSIPAEAVTREFLFSAKRALKPGGILVMNVVSSPALSDAFSVRIYNTVASVFPVFRQQIITGRGFNGWSTGNAYANTLYIYYDNAWVTDKAVYTDDKNTYSLDH